MGIIIRQGIKSTLTMYLGGVLGVLNRLYLMPKYLSLEQMGILDLLLIAGLLFANLASFGTIGTLVKFYHKFDSTKRLENYVGYLLKISFIGVVLISFLLYVLKPGIIDYYKKDSSLVNHYFPFFYVFLVALFLKGFLANYSLTNQRATVPSFLFDFCFKAIQAILLVIVGLYFLDFNTFIILLSIGYYFLILTLYFYNKKQFNLSISFKSATINKQDRSEIRNYSFFVWFASISGTITQFVDTAMVGSYEGLAMAGVYSVAFNLGQSIEMPKRAISSISFPIIVKHLDNKEFNAVNKLYKQSSINQGLIGALFLLLIFVCIDSIFYLLPKSNELEIGKNIALIIGFARFIDMITGVNSEILRSTDKYKLDFYIIGFFIVLSVWLNYLLIPKYGIEGAAFASLIAIVGFNTIRILLLKHLYNFFPFTKESIYLLLVIIILISSRFLLPSNPWHSQIGAIGYIFIQSFLYGGLFIYITYKLKISSEWNHLLEKVLSIIVTPIK